MSVNINDLLVRAAALRDETALNSISPDRAGGIMYDTLLAMNELWLQQGAALVISKIYASVAAMEADSAPVSDLTSQPLRPGQIVVIASSDSDNGSVYRYDGTTSAVSTWSKVGIIGGGAVVDSLDSDSPTLPLAAHQGKVLDEKIESVSNAAPKIEEGQANADLEFSDENGNVLVRFRNGHIQTKEFDSEDMNIEHPVAVGDGAGGQDLDITDDFGNVLVRFAGGNVIVKNFNSMDVIGYRLLD